MAEDQQQQPRESNRYAHLLGKNCGPGLVNSNRPVIVANRMENFDSNHPQVNNHQQTSFSQQQPTANSNGNNATRAKPRPPLYKAQDPQQRANYNYYGTSFSSIDWREQWILFKERVLEKVEDPQGQRKLILFIVCCALLLDNMLYMVIVPIIPDYLRKIGAWETYRVNSTAEYLGRNRSHGRAVWLLRGGHDVYEGEESAVGFLFASKAIVQLLINPFSGTLIDRIGYEVPMMIGLIVMFFSTMVFACGQTYSILLLARSLQGFGSAFADTSGLAMIADRFTEENERQRALGIALAFISFGSLFAPPFGSVLYETAGKEIPFIILSLVCLLDGSLLLLITDAGTFAQILPNYYQYNYNYSMQHPPQQQEQYQLQQHTKEPGAHPGPVGDQQQQQRQQLHKSKPPQLQRQKSVSRRQSMTLASQGEAPKGTPIYVLFRDPCIACCAGALVVANVSLAFLEPTITIWVKNTMPDVGEGEMGMIWLPGFVPHVLGVYMTVRLADKYPRYQWLIAFIGLLLEGFACLMVPFCKSFWFLTIPISIICFGIALIDTAILPTLSFLVDTRYVSVYGSIYAIADISYSVSYAVGPIIAGGIVEAIGFTALNILIGIVTLGYAPSLMMLRTIRDYEPFEMDQSGLKAGQEKPFGQFGRKPICADEDDDGFGNGGLRDDLDSSDNNYHRPLRDDQPAAPAATTTAATKYDSPRWASGGAAVARNRAERTTSIVRGSSIKSQAGAASAPAPSATKTVTIAEQPAPSSRPEAANNKRDEPSSGADDVESAAGAIKNPFMAD